MRLFLTLVLFIILSACSHKPYSVQANDKGKLGQMHTVYVLSHSWHTAFVLAAHDIQEQVPELKTRFPQAVYLTVGWGDADVYQADETGFWASTYAIMLPTDSVLHVLESTEKPEIRLGETSIHALCLAEQNYQNLLQYIANSFAHNAKEKVIPTPLNDGENSQFYQAVGNYYFMNTCNNWTAKGLQSAGFDISPTFKFTSGSISNYLAHHHPKPSPQCLAQLAK